ncbi:MAG TPA: iron-sulfur cluster assembly protein [Rectinemataceae bacterium]
MEKSQIDSKLRSRIDSALARVLEPQSNVPIVDLGLVRNVRYSEKERTILVSLAIGYPRGECPACAAINGVVGAGIARRVEEEFAKEFPDLRVIVE